MKLFQRRNIQFGSCRLLGTDKIIECHTAKTNISNEQWLPMQTSSSFKIHTVQCALCRISACWWRFGPRRWALYYENVTRCWHLRDISVTSPWHLAPEISDQLVQITDSDQLTDIVSPPPGRAAHTTSGKIHNSPLSLHLPLCSFLRSQITVCSVLPSSLVLVSASPPLQ